MRKDRLTNAAAVLLFNFIDRDRSGYIDREEMMEAFEDHPSLFQVRHTGPTHGPTPVGANVVTWNGFLFYR